MLRTRQRDPEVASLRPVGKEILTRTNAITPSRNKIIEGVINGTSTPTGLRREVTTDETHGAPPYREGGPFFSVKLYYPDFAVPGYSIRGKDITQPNSTTGAFQPGDVWTRRYEGGCYIAQGFAYMSSSLGSKENMDSSEDYDPVVNPNDLDTLGPRGWSKLRPKVERASVAQSVIELREAPRMLQSSVKSASSVWEAMAGRKYRNVADLRKVPKELSQEFLNVQFGWKPLVRDVTAASDVVINFDKYVETTKRNNDRWLKRQWNEEVLESSDLVHNEGGLANSRIAPKGTSDYFVSWTSNYQVFKETFSDVWYEGSFKYYRPEFDAGLESGYPAVRRARQMLSLLGGNITPTVLYKVTPWTWLVDWFVNVGDNVQRFEDMATGQVAARYMYLMRHTREQYRYYTSSQAYHGQGYVTVEAFRRLEVKCRVQSAGNFHFSLQPTGLSGTQLAILAALGITR